MRKIFTIITLSLVFSHLPAQQLSGGNTSTTRTIVNTSDAPEPTKNSMESPDAAQIMLYPNPANDQIKFSVNEKLVGHTIRIYSLLGSELINRNITSAQESVEVSTLPQGLYIYNIIDKNNKTILTGKFNKL
jgi:hypothetical protein